jgi:protein tyrosine/serine phosphatase
MSNNRARSRIAALIAVSLVAVPAAGGSRLGDERTAEAALARIRIDNFGRINERFYRGAQPKGGDYTDLAALGVKTLINLTSDDAMADEKAMAARAGIAYFQIPMTTHRVPSAAQLSEFLSIATNPAHQPVYVHCVGGRHRTGVMTAVYRMTQDGWTATQAFNEMKQYNFGADFLHREFKDFVLGFKAAKP